MLRLTEIRLGLEHTEAELRAAMLRALGIAEAELVAWHVRRRGYDARRSGEIVFVYTLDVEVRDEAALLAKLHGAPAQSPGRRMKPTAIRCAPRPALRSGRS